jgi:hypothetical protein
VAHPIKVYAAKSCEVDIEISIVNSLTTFGTVAPQNGRFSARIG